MMTFDELPGRPIIVVPQSDLFMIGFIEFIQKDSGIESWMSAQHIWNPVRWTERWAAFSLQTHCANRVELGVLNQNPLWLRLDRGKGQWRPGIWSCFAMGWSCCIINSGRLQSLQGNTSNIFSDPVELNSLKKSSKDLNLPVHPRIAIFVDSDDSVLTEWQIICCVEVVLHCGMLRRMAAQAWCRCFWMQEQE